MSKIEEKRGINFSNFKVLDGLHDLPCILKTNVHGCQCVQKDHLNAIKYCPQQWTHLHDVKLYSFRIPPTVILKNRVYSQKYSYTNKSML